MSMNKYITKVAGSNPVPGSRDSLTEAKKKSDAAGAERGDVITYTIAIKNDSSTAVSTLVTETFDSNIFKVTADSTKDGWKKKSNNVYTRTVTVAKGKTLKINMYLQVKNAAALGSSYENTAKISDFKVGKTSMNNKAGLKVEAKDWIKVKKYKASISKSVKQIAGKNVTDNTKYADINDEVIFAITIKNTGTGNYYGAIKNIVITDSFSSSEMELLSFRASNKDTFVKSGKTSGNWQLSGSNSSYTIKYTGSLGLNKDATVYIKFKEKVVANDGRKITNKATMSKTIQNKNDVKCDLDSAPSAEAFYYLKKYAFKVNKYLVKVGSTSLKSGSNWTRETNKNGKIYADAGTAVVFAVTIENSGSTPKYGSVKTISLVDTYTAAQMDFLEGKAAGESNYITSGKSGNWTIGKPKKSGANYQISLKYSGTIDPGKKVTVYLKFRSKVLEKTSTEVKNIIEYDAGTVYNKNNVDLKSFFNKKSSSDKFNSKIYKLKTSKYVYKVKGNKTGRPTDTSTIYADYWDTVVFRIDIKNEGNSDAYGTFHKNIVIKDDISNSKYVEFMGFLGKGSNYVKTGESGDWKISSVKSTGFNLTYTKELPINTTATVYIKFRVIDYEKTNITVTNKIEIDNLYNINYTSDRPYCTVYNNTSSPTVNKLASGSSRKSSDKFIIKKYTINVGKYISHINGVRTSHTYSNKTQEVYVEFGDIITYKFRVANSGKNDGSEGSFKEVSIKDAYPDKVLTLLDDKDQNYTVTSNDSGEKGKWTRSGNTFKYTSSNEIGTKKISKADEYVELTLKFRVDGIDKADLHITNTVNLSQAKNGNNKTISKLNGTLEDSETATLLTYNIEVSKYITKVQNSVVADRKLKTNEQKSNGPVLVEKEDKVIYAMRIKNSSTKAVLHSVTAKDMLPEGIEFSGSATITIQILILLDQMQHQRFL